MICTEENKTTQHKRHRLKTCASLRTRSCLGALSIVRNSKTSPLQGQQMTEFRATKASPLDTWQSVRHTLAYLASGTNI